MKEKMLRHIVIALATGAIIPLAGCNDAREPATDEEEVEAVVDAIENQQFCPVMEDNEINKDIYVDHEGKRVYFCCPGCVQVFQADPDTYMERLKKIHADPDDEAQPEAHEH